MNPFTHTEPPFSIPLLICVWVHAHNFYKPAGMTQPAPGVILSVSYIINTQNPVLRTSWGILSGSSLLRTVICGRAGLVSYQISLSNHRKIPHLIELLSNQPDQSPMSWLSEKNVYYHINMKSGLTLYHPGRALGLETQDTWVQDKPDTSLFSDPSASVLHLQSRVYTNFSANLLETLK